MTLNTFLSSVSGTVDTSVDRIGRLVGIDIPIEFATSKALKAQRVVRRYAALSFAGGFIPLPLVDMLAVSSSQLAMLAEITAIYENGQVPNRERLKLVASSVLGSVVPQGLTAGVAGSGIKALPVVGTFAGMVLMPGLSSAVTYAIGKAFITHFESGGTVDSIDPVEMGNAVATEIASPNGFPVHASEPTVDVAPPALTEVETAAVTKSRRVRASIVSATPGVA